MTRVERITAIDRGAGADESRYNIYVGPHYTRSPHTFAAAGQLWTLLADARLNGAALERNQWVSMCLKRSELGTHSGRRFIRGSRIIDLPAGAASGILRGTHPITWGVDSFDDYPD